MSIIMTVTQIYSNLITLFLRSAIAAAPRLENITQASLSSTIRFSPHLSAKMPYSREIVNLQVRLVAVIDSSCGWLIAGRTSGEPGLSSYRSLPGPTSNRGWQVGESFWEMLLAEHGLDHSGVSESFWGYLLGWLQLLHSNTMARTHCRCSV